ncbi:hypothetical protein ATANTOWER_017541, partial [Ataeniobius toweri]|nr:hypothetical protein [Ataeniobius toweri]
SELPNLQETYLAQVLADSSKPSSFSKQTLLTLQPLPSHTASGNLTRISSCINRSPRLHIILPRPNSISIWCLQSRFQFHYSSL